MNVAACVMIVLFSLTSSVVLARAEDTEGEARRVVILNATDPYLPAFLALDGGVRAALRDTSRVATELFAETLDMYRFPRARLDPDVVALLRKKYRDLEVDVVVAAGTTALDFARDNRPRIWPGASIVFHSVPTAALVDRSLDPRTIGVPVALELGQTLDLTLRLWPTIRQIAVIAGTAEPDIRHLELARAALGRYAEKLDVRYLVGLTVAETVAAVRELPQNALVLYLTIFRDAAGAPQVPRDVLTRISAVSRAPIFGVFETYLGHGIAAGSITDYEAQGRRAGELVARVLNGEDPAAIGVQAPLVPRCIADWRQLRRWDIDEGLLPADCEVRFKEIADWERYRWQILAVSAVILAQAALIVALIINRRRLRHAQETLADEYARRTQTEGLAARLRASWPGSARSGAWVPWPPPSPTRSISP